MSTHYLINPFDTNATVVDVLSAQEGVSSSTGALVVRVPQGVPIRSVTDESDLRVKKPTTLNLLQKSKAEGLLEKYGNFANIVYNTCLTSAEVDTESLTSKVVLASGLSNHMLFPSGVVKYSSITIADQDNNNVFPTSILVLWEGYTTTEDFTNGRLLSQYIEQDSLLTCNITIQGGDVSLAGDPYFFSATVANGQVMNLPQPEVDSGGTPYMQFVLQFGNDTTSRVHLGSWAVLF